MHTYRKKLKPVKETKLLQPESNIANEIKEAFYDKDVQEVAFYSEDAIQSNGSTFTFKYPEFWKTINDEKLAIGIRGVYFNKSRRVMKFMLNLDIDFFHKERKYNLKYLVPIKYEIKDNANIRDFINFVNEEIELYVNRIKTQWALFSFCKYNPEEYLYNSYVLCFKNNFKLVLGENSIDNCDKYNIYFEFESDLIIDRMETKVSFKCCNYYALNFFNIPDNEITEVEYGYKTSIFYPIDSIKVPVNADLNLNYLVSATFVTDDIHKHLGKTNLTFEPIKIYPIISGSTTFDLTFYTLDGLQYVEIPNCDSSFYIEAVLLRKNRQKYIM